MLVPYQQVSEAHVVWWNDLMIVIIKKKSWKFLKVCQKLLFNWRV